MGRLRAGLPGPGPRSERHRREAHPPRLRLRQHQRGRRGGHAWLFDGSTPWTYDDPQVLRSKSRYVRDHGLGGAMFWSLDADTADGELMTAVDQALRGGR
ncbi:glycosyl hydrolase family 18 protein [Streptomyces goshikiensis]